MIWKKLFSGKKSDDAVGVDCVNPQEASENAVDKCVDKIPAESDKNLQSHHFLRECLFAETQAESLIVPQKEISKQEGSLWGKIRQAQNNVLGLWTKRKLSLDALDDLEDSLIQADLGTKLAMQLREKLEAERFDKEISEQELKIFLKREMLDILQPMAQKMVIPSVPEGQKKPHVIMFVGVNGTGKTTTIGKIAHHFKGYGKSVMMVAGDTYRAAATEQLVIWGQRNDVPVVAGEQGTDAAHLIYKGYGEAVEQGVDILLIDTAGRLQNKNNLMQELLKMTRVLQKYEPDLPHEIVLVLDATTGQNALQQAEIFRDMANITGIMLTKLDGTAKGGALVNVTYHLRLPIYAVGLGEKIDDLYGFNPNAFVDALLDIE